MMSHLWVSLCSACNNASSRDHPSNHPGCHPQACHHDRQHSQQRCYLPGPTRRALSASFGATGTAICAEVCRRCLSLTTIADVIRQESCRCAL